MPENCLPNWDAADLPEPQSLSWRNWASFIGPGIVMMGIQIGGGEWLFGPEITAKYGGSLMWIATVAIVFQVFYNLECGRYALYCGEPIMTGFMRTRPGPMFWMSGILLLNFSALIPGLTTHGAAIIAALWLDRPPGLADRNFVNFLAYICLAAVVVPVLVGGKVYNMLQTVMTVKVAMVLGFCLFIGVFFVSPSNWWNVFSGFAKFGNAPAPDGQGGEKVVNVLGHFWKHGEWPTLALANIAVLGAFAGYAGGGGLSNSTYSNFVRDKGWGMGSLVGAIPSAVGGKHVTLSHVGKAFPATPENMRRWRGWWRYVLWDQLFVWGPGCFMGMALPALVSIQFAEHSSLYKAEKKLDWAQAIISADGIRHAPQFGETTARLLWLAALFTGIMVMLPSQMSIVDDFSRRWTDSLWSGNRFVRERMRPHQVKYIYYAILSSYVVWSFVCAYLFNTYGTPKLMTIVIANLNNLAIGLTAFHLLWINHRLLPPALRPRWYNTLGLLGCGFFYLSLAAMVFFEKQWPVLRDWLSS